MTAGLEPLVAEEFIYNTLHGDATLMAAVHDVWNVQAPQNTPFPFVTFQFMSGIDLMVVGAIRVWTDMVYQIKVIGQTADFGDLSAAVARIDALLHRTSGTTADGTTWACVREQAVRMPETDSGQQYRHAGGLFRIYAT